MHISTSKMLDFIKPKQRHFFNVSCTCITKIILGIYQQKFVQNYKIIL